MSLFLCPSSCDIVDRSLGLLMFYMCDVTHGTFVKHYQPQAAMTTVTYSQGWWGLSRQVVGGWVRQRRPIPGQWDRVFTAV